MAITTTHKQVGEVASSRRGKPRTSRAEMRETIWGYLFLLPTIMLILVFGVYPQLGSIRYALYNWDGIGVPTQFVGLRHIIGVATDPLFWNAYRHTLIYTVALVLIQLPLALMLALILNNPKLRINSFYRALFFLPALTTTSVVAVVISLLSARVSANFPDWLVRLGLVHPDLGLLNDPNLTLPLVILFGIWHGFGYNLVYFLAALQTVPAELYEAARIDGAGPLGRFWYVTIPMIRPVGAIILLLATFGSIGVFDSVWVLTQGGPLYASDVVSTYIYRNAFSATVGPENYGLASGAALFFSLTLFAFSGLNLFMMVRLRRQQRELGESAATTAPAA